MHPTAPATRTVKVKSHTRTLPPKLPGYAKGGLVNPLDQQMRARAAAVAGQPVDPRYGQAAGIAGVPLEQARGLPPPRTGPLSPEEQARVDMLGAKPRLAGYAAGGLVMPTAQDEKDQREFAMNTTPGVGAGGSFQDFQMAKLQGAADTMARNNAWSQGHRLTAFQQADKTNQLDALKARAQPFLGDGQPQQPLQPQQPAPQQPQPVGAQPPAAPLPDKASPLGIPSALGFQGLPGLANPAEMFQDAMRQQAIGFRKGGSVGPAGLVTGGKPGKDSVPIMAMPNEYMLPEKSADALGGPPALDALVRATTGKEPGPSPVPVGDGKMKAGFARGGPVYSPSQLKALIESGAAQGDAQIAAERVARAARAAAPAPTPPTAQATQWGNWAAENAKPGVAPADLSVKPAPSTLSKVGRAVGRVAGSPAATGIGLMLAPNTNIASQQSEDAELARFAGLTPPVKTAPVALPAPGGITSPLSAQDQKIADLTRPAKAKDSSIVAALPAPTSGPSTATAAFETSPESARQYQRQLEVAGGRALPGGGYEMPSNARVTARGLADQVNATYSPAEREARMKAVFDPANVARAQADAKANPGNPDYYNGLDVSGMGPAEYMALKGMTGQQEADLGAARQFYSMPASERGAAPAAVTRAMAPGPAPVTQFGAAVEQRTRGTQAEAAKLQNKLDEATIAAGGKAATDATRRWDSYQASVPRELRALGKANPDTGDTGLSADGQSWASEALARVMNQAKAMGADVPGPDLIQTYAQIAKQYIRPRATIIAQLQKDNPKLDETELSAAAERVIAQDRAKAAAAERAMLSGAVG